MKIGNDVISEKVIFIASIADFIYIVFLISSVRLQYDSVAIVGVFREMLDIPGLLLLPVLLTCAIIDFAKGKFKFNTFFFDSLR